MLKLLYVYVPYAPERGKYEHDRGMADTMVNQMELLIHSYRNYQKLNEEEKCEKR